MAQITLPREFFTKERNTGYSNWHRAFWRELLSNSLDAGATEFNVTREDDHLRIEDNGSGMSREVCENVYLSIGRSTKDSSEGTVGGFGRARILTCFSMDRYIIEGDGYRVEGSGAEYHIFESDPRERGLILNIFPDQSSLWLHNLTIILNQCELPGLKVTFDGIQIYSTPLQPENGEYIPLASTDFGDLGSLSIGKAGFVSESLLDSSGLSTGQIYFRVNGMAMFEHYSRVKKAALIVEIDPAVARSVLTANRDGLKPGAWDSIHALVEEVEREGKTALKKVHREQLICGDLSKIELMNDGMAASRELDLTHQGSPFAPTPDGLTAARDTLDFTPKGYFDKPMCFSVASSDQTFLAVANSWRPGFQTHAMSRLFAAWVSACKLGLETFAKIRPHKNYHWLPGLVFRAGVEAEAQRLSHHLGVIYTLSINPIGPSRDVFPEEPAYNPHSLLFNMTQPASRQRLFAVALHEIAHIDEMQHDSDYANTLTELMCQVDLAKFLKISKEW